MQSPNDYETYFSQTQCTPTAQFRLDIQTIEYGTHQVDGKSQLHPDNDRSADNPPSTIRVRQRVQYVLQSLDEHGQPKTTGGDEFYPVYFDAKQMETQPPSTFSTPTAVAHVQDNNDGTYALTFEEPPYEPPTGSLHGHGSLQLHYGYTCNIGRQTAPFKATWKACGNAFETYTIANLTTPPEINPFRYPPEISGDQNRTGTAVDLSSYDKVVCCGDSTMKNFCGMHQGRKPEFSYRGVNGIGNFGGYFRHDQWRELAIPVVKKLYGQDLEVVEQDESKRVAVILGSAAWDILADEFPPQDNNFTSSLGMYREIISWFRETHPRVTVLWKSPQPIHLHAAQAVKNRPGAMNRLKYGSISTARYLHEQQMSLMDELGVPVLNIWNASYLSSHHHRSHDALHYDTDLNHRMIDMFFMNATMKQMDQHR